MWLLRKLRDPLIWPAIVVACLGFTLYVVLAPFSTAVSLVPGTIAILATTWLTIWIN